MLIFHYAQDLHAWINRDASRKKNIGFIPTMGALHEGHLSLVRKAAKDSSLVIVSIFVNPTQFNEEKDFLLYPTSLAEDIRLLASVRNCVLYHPSREEIYPNGTTLQQTYPLGDLENILEGSFRPGHFQGVCQVVDRLLSLVQPHHLYLGEKDFQQCQVIHKLLQQTDRGKQIRLYIEPTIRELDGLAMSSRNRRLSEVQRKQAALIYQAMCQAEKELATDSIDTIQEKGIRFLEAAGFQVDYFEIADAETLKPAMHSQKNGSLRVFVAARIGDIRLIDNMEIRSEASAF